MLNERKKKILHGNIKDIFSRSQFIEKWRRMEYSGCRNRAGEEGFLVSAFSVPCCRLFFRCRAVPA